MLDTCSRLGRIELALGALLVLGGAVFLWRAALVYRTAARRAAVLVDLHARTLEAQVDKLDRLTREEQAERPAVLPRAP
jgi:hypothetical protein